jgi:hypothetical protein
MALGGLDALEQRLVLFTPQQLAHLLLNRRAQPRYRAVPGGAPHAEASPDTKAVAQHDKGIRRD